MAKCAQCKEKEGQRDGVCPACRLRALGRKSRRYRFTAEQQDAIRAAYRLRKGPRGIALARIAREAGWPVHALKSEAIRMGLTTYTRRPWSAEEIAYVDTWCGRMSAKAIAKDLKRSCGAVESRMAAMELSRRLRRGGYSIGDLAQVFGSTEVRVAGWVRRGLMGKVDYCGGLRVSESGVKKFIQRCTDLYDLRRVDQTWFLGVLFGADSAGR